MSSTDQKWPKSDWLFVAVLVPALFLLGSVIGFVDSAYGCQSAYPASSCNLGVDPVFPVVLFGSVALVSAYFMGKGRGEWEARRKAEVAPPPEGMETLSSTSHAFYSPSPPPAQASPAWSSYTSHPRAGLLFCPSCGSGTPAGYTYCQKCGVALPS